MSHLKDHLGGSIYRSKRDPHNLTTMSEIGIVIVHFVYVSRIKEEFCYFVVSNLPFHLSLPQTLSHR